MTKKGATILALVTTFFYFVVCIVVMLVYRGEAGVTATNNQFLIFLLVQAPRLIFLFGLTVFLLVLSALPIEKKGKGKGTTQRKTTTTTRVTKTVKPTVKKVEREEVEETDGE